MSLLRSHQLGALYLLIASVGWGLNWPAIKLLLREAPPLSARGWAGLTAAVGLALLAKARGERLAVPRQLAGRLVLAAMVNVFVWMGFATVSMLWLNAGEAALLVYTMPIWVSLLGWPILGHQPTARTAAALALGFAGVGVLLGAQDIAVGVEKLPGVALALSSAFLFAFGTVATRSTLSLPPLAAVAWQVGIGCVPMVAFGLLFETFDLDRLTWIGWSALAYMVAIPMSVSYLCWFGALRHLTPASASIGTLLTPIIGVIMAAIVLGEPLGLRELLALILTLSGVALALRKE